MYDVSLAAALLIYLVVGVYYLRSPVASIYHPLSIYGAFHGFLFVFRPIIARINDYDFVYSVFGFQPAERDKITVILAASLGFVVFAATSLRAGNVPMRFSNTAWAREERRRYVKSFLWVLAIAGPPALYSLSTIYSDTHFIYAGMRMDVETGISINTTQSGYVSDMQLMLVPLVAVPLWLARFRVLYFLPVLAFVILRAGSGGRGPFVAALAATGLFYLYERRLRTPGLKVLLGAALTIWLFAMIGDDRGVAVRQLLGKQDAMQVTRDLPARMEGMDFANMEYFEYLVYVIPQRSGTYDYFLDNFQLFTEPVPRIYWPGKPIGEPFRRITLTNYGRPYGMTKSLPGEGWYAMGWLGVAIWCALWGTALGTLYRKYVNSAQTVFHTAAYMVFLPTLITGFRDGILLTIAKQSGMFMAPILLWWWFSSRMTRSRGVPHPRQVKGSSPAARAGAIQAPAGTLGLPAAVARRRLALASTRMAQAAGIERS